MDVWAWKWTCSVTCGITNYTLLTGKHMGTNYNWIIFTCELIMLRDHRLAKYKRMDMTKVQTSQGKMKNNFTPKPIKILSEFQVR